MESSQFVEKRIEKVRNKLTEKKLDASFVTSKYNFMYLMGYKTEAPSYVMIPAADKDAPITIFTNPLEAEIVKAKTQLKNIDIHVAFKSIPLKAQKALKNKETIPISYEGKEYFMPKYVVENLAKSDFNKGMEKILRSNLTPLSDLPAVNLETLIRKNLEHLGLKKGEWEGTPVLVPRTLAMPAVAEYLAVHGVSKLALENSHITLDTYYDLKKNLKKVGKNAIGLQDASRLFIECRIIKDKQELSILKQAALIGDKGFAAAEKAIHEGMTENEVQAEAEYAMKRGGAAGPAFETIVVSGKNSGFPHGHASDKIIDKGDLVTVDLGAWYKGYASDMTRTVIAGHDSSENLKLIHRRVNKAYEIGIEAVRAGIGWAEPDIAVRKYFSDLGVLDYYNHSLGHGVGTEIHESPWISFRRSQPEMIIRPGMVFTIEPGLYYPELGGSRTENTLVVLEDGIEILNETKITHY